MNVHNESWEAGGKTSYISNNAFDDVNKATASQQRTTMDIQSLGFSYWQSSFSPGISVADCDNDKTLDLLCSIVETLPHGKGSRDNSQFCEQTMGRIFPSWSLTSLNSQLLLFPYLEKPSKLSWTSGKGQERPNPFHYRDFK